MVSATQKIILPLLIAGLLAATPGGAALAALEEPAIPPGPTLEEPTIPPGPTLEEPAPTPGIAQEEPTPTPGIAQEEPTPTPGIAQEEPTPTPAMGEPPPAETPPAETNSPLAHSAALGGQALQYGVEIAWHSLEFELAPQWNTETYCYDSWASSVNPITVKNTSPTGAPMQITLTFVPNGAAGVYGVFSPTEGDPNPTEFMITGGTAVTFTLPRPNSQATEAEVNLSLTGAPGDWEVGQAIAIGSIKADITPLDALFVPPPAPQAEGDAIDTQAQPDGAAPTPEPTPAPTPDLGEEPAEIAPPPLAETGAAQSAAHTPSPPPVALPPPEKMFGKEDNS